MAKAVTRFVCQSCGAVTPKWAGRCETCGEWNTVEPETIEARPGATAKAATGASVNFVGLHGETAPPPRAPTGIDELDRVLGGGLVPSSAVLVGGDPGIGKSTLLLQAAARLAATGKRVLYITGEEAIEQVRLRARRLGVADSPIELAASINVRDIIASLERAKDATMVVIDSIQTMWLDAIDSAPGTVSQVRACSFELIRAAKSGKFALVLVGHVTKEGGIAGPRVLEHMVDAVLYFEGDRGHQFRILRAVKNRYGATDEIGVFEMTDVGLAEVANPSALFLAERRGNIAGSAVFAGLEGTRPVLVEIQALLAPNQGGSPRRSVTGWDSGRLSMLLAVLETRAGVRLNMTDVWLNVAGGLRVNEPAADLAVAAAIASAAFDQPTAPGTVYFGEIGLSGEVRQVAQAEARLKEAAELGFDSATLPRRIAHGNRRLSAPDGLTLEEIGHIADLVVKFGPETAENDRVFSASRKSRTKRRQPEGGQTAVGGTMTSVDLVVLGVMFISGMIAFMRGFVREILSIGAWIGAAAVSITCLPLVRPLLAPYMPSPEWTDPAGYVILFLVALIVLSLIAKTIAGAVRSSSVGGIDRSLGLVFGLARGAALAVAIYIGACMAVPPEHWPPPVLESRALPYIYTGAAWIARQIPPEYRPAVPPPPPPATRQTALDGILKVSPVGRAIDPPLRGNAPHG